MPRVLKTHAPGPLLPEVDAGEEAPLPEGWVVQNHEGKTCYGLSPLQGYLADNKLRGTSLIRNRHPPLGPP